MKWWIFSLQCWFEEVVCTYIDCGMIFDMLYVDRFRYIKVMVLPGFWPLIIEVRSLYSTHGRCASRNSQAAWNAKQRWTPWEVWAHDSQVTIRTQCWSTFTGLSSCLSAVSRKIVFKFAHESHKPWCPALKTCVDIRDRFGTIESSNGSLRVFRAGCGGISKLQNLQGFAVGECHCGKTAW